MGYVTNGIHVPTFLSSAWANFLDGQLPGWRERPERCGFLGRPSTEMLDALFWVTGEHENPRMPGGVCSRLAREFKRKRLGSVQLGHITKLSNT